MDRPLVITHNTVSLGDLAGEAAAVDVIALGSSKGGTGRAVPPDTLR